MTFLKKFRTLPALLIALSILFAASVSSCEKKSSTEAEGTEHPADSASSEHPEDEAEHPADTTKQ